MAPSSATAPAASCSLHIRLFDGTSIRCKFAADATLTTAVRTFVSENSSTDIPYNFRIMDLPRPARTIEISEENQSLRDLGLCPNATLVLVPVKDFTDAYASQGAIGVVNKGINMGYNMAFGAFSMVGDFLGKATGQSADGDTTDGPYIAGTGDSPSQHQTRSEGKQAFQEEKPLDSSNATKEGKQKGQQPAEFYNGNTTNVEPRPEDRT